MKSPAILSVLMAIYVLIMTTGFAMPQTGNRGRRQPPEYPAWSTIDDLFEALAYNPGFTGEWLDYARGQSLQGSGVGRPYVPMIAILNDGRVTKLHEELSKLPPAEASQKLVDFTENYLRDYKEWWGGQLPNPTDLLGKTTKMHPLQSCLFLATCFCETEDFDRLAADWTEWYVANLDLEKSRHNMDEKHFKYYAGPDELMLINLGVIVMSKANPGEDEKPDLHELDSRVQAFGQEMGFGALPALEMMKLHDTELEFPVFRHWGKAREITSNANHHDTRLRTMLMSRALYTEPDALEQWLQELGTRRSDRLRAILGIE